MRLLETWVQTPLAGAIGWTLLHSLWEGAILSAALAAALAALRSPRARYAAACVAMLLMLGGFGLTLIRVMPDGVDSLRTERTLVFPARNVRAGVDASSPSNPGLAAVVPWLAPFWVAGVWMFYLGHVAGWISVCRLRRRGVCCAPERWQKELARLSARLRLSRPVLLLESCLAEAPTVVGHFRPFILMPVGLLAGLPAGQIEAILLHELAHIRRYDYLVNVFQRSVEGLLFYHPAVWWMSRVIRAERENCCDDVVVAMSGNPHEYAVALTALEQNRCSSREPAVAATGGSLVKRIRRLLYPQGTSGAWTPLFAAIILMANAAVALVAWQAAPQQSIATAQSQAGQTSPYDKWLNQDVVYIIDDKERAAFKALTADEERENFIVQFWLRRDPTPGTPENEFKEEHYRRIAYANERFAAIDLPGWKTDRGRIYIIFGPPDEIESHPSGGGQDRQAPFEEWLYHHIEGVGDNIIFGFTDPLLSREYRLTLNPLLAMTAVRQSLQSSERQAAPDRIRIGTQLQEKNLLTKVDPIYPPLARQARIQGVVRFTVVIGKDGRVSNIALVSGHPLLVAAARDALSQWVYRPTLLNGEPVEVISEASVNFALGEQ
ncbi:MAG: TonB family protein [Acidobacteriia bacterium]|nr:TonB family protein [Terriglobia bacterium]